MARIETYGSDTFITAFDKVIGTDADSNKASKNYEMGAIRDYVVSGLPPNGGLLKVTHVIQDTPIEDVETPEDLLNQLAIPLDVVEFEIVIVTLTFNDSNDNDRLKTRKFLLNRMMVTFGVGEIDQAISNDFILIEKEDVDLVGAISNALLSIGDEGYDVYKGYNSDKHEIRKIKSSTLEGSIDGDSVKLEIPSSMIDASTKTLTSIGDAGEDVYKGLNGNNHEIRKIKSDTLLVSIDGDAIKIESEEVDLGGVRNFYVNNQYTGDEELGTIAKPYKTVDLAVTDYIGSGNIYTPEFENSRIIVQSSNSNYSFTKPLNIQNLKFEVQSGATARYIGSQEYMCDLRELLTHVDYDSSINLLVEFYGDGAILSLDKGLLYARGSEGYSLTNYSSINIYDNITLKHSYKTVEGIKIPKTVGGTDYYEVNGVPTVFSTNEANIQPAIVCDGDNLVSVNIAVIGSMVLEVTNQIGVLVKNEGYLFKNATTTGNVTIKTLAHYAPKVGVNVNITVNELIPNSLFNFIRLEDGSVYLSELQTSIGNMTDLGSNMESIIYVGEPIVASINYLTLLKGVAISGSEAENFIDNDCSASSHMTSISNFTSQGGSNSYFYKNSHVDLETKLTMNNCTLDKSISSNIDLTRSNLISVNNIIESQIVHSLRSFSDRVTAAATLPVGGIFINTNSDNVDDSTHFIDTVI